MLAVDFLLLKPPTIPPVVLPATRVRPTVINERPKSLMASALPLEAAPADIVPIPATTGAETNNSIIATSHPQAEPILADVDASETTNWDFSWSLFDWVEPNQYPMARFALRYVGVDRDAEDYWYAAINDGTLSADERSNLIEDLNEEGFQDPDNLTADDLPLIERRIQIIELLGPDAMDDVNAAAFAEAYKDLVDMYYSVESENQPEDSASEMSGGSE